MSTALDLVVSASSGSVTLVVGIAADQLRRWAARQGAQLDRIERRLGERMDATDARVDQLDEKTDRIDRSVAGLVAIQGYRDRGLGEPTWPRYWGPPPPDANPGAKRS